MDEVFGMLRALAVWGSSHQYGMLGIAGGTLLLALIGAGLRRHHERSGGSSHGSARFATLREVRKSGLLSKEGIVIGKLAGRTLRVPQLHVLVCGPSGSGKDVSVNIPTAITWRGSLLSVDPKDGGENYAICGKARAKLGPVFRFAPNLPGSHQYNPLDMIRLGTPQEFGDTMALVKNLLAPAQKDTRTSDTGSFFARQGAIAGRGVLLYALYTMPRGQATLHACCRLMQDAEACCTGMAKHPHPEIQGTGQELLTLMKESSRQFAGEWSTSKGALDIFKDPLIAHATSRSDFQLTDLQFGKRPITLYLGAETVTDLLYLYPLFRAIIQGAYHQLTRSQAHQRRRHELLMALNEFPQLGYMEILEHAPAHARSYGIRFLIIIQDLAQLFHTYGHETAIWGNVATKVFHRPDHDETAARMERMLGPETVEVTSRQSGGRGRSQSQSPTGRALLTQAEILGLGAEEEIIWAPNCPHPILARKIRYWKDSY